MARINPSSGEIRESIRRRVHFDLEEIIRSRHGQLRQFIRSRVRNEDDVEDLLQTTYLEALRNGHRFQGLSRPDVWLCGIALNVIRNYVKRECLRNQRCVSAQSMEQDLQDLEGASQDPGLINQHRQALNRVKGAFERLPDDMQQVISLVVDRNRDYQEAARELGVPTGTIRSRLSRAREKLRARTGV